MPSETSPLSERIRVRLRHDPGDELFIDGKRTRVAWPATFMRLATGIAAEVVLDSEEYIQTLPAEAWTGSREELLRLAWAKTLMAVEVRVSEVEVGGHRILMVQGEAPYVTACALTPCKAFGPPDFPDAPAALVAVPTSDCVLVHLFADDTCPDRDRVSAFVAALAEKVSSQAEERDRVSERVYLARADRELALEDVPEPSDEPVRSAPQRPVPDPIRSAPWGELPARPLLGRYDTLLFVVLVLAVIGAAVYFALSL